MRIIKTLSRTTSRTLLDLILPPRCPVTGALVGRNGTIAPEFWAQLNFIQDSYCAQCGAPFREAMEKHMVCGACLQEPPPFARARAALRYDDHSAKMILKFKHADALQLAKIFATWLQQAGTELLTHTDLLIPVPLHRWRLLKRRYNQAALLSAALAKHSGVAHHPHLLRRQRHTPTQGQKSKTERHDNIKHAFVVPDHLQTQIKDKTILLIDDVYTSGATVNECTKILLKAGAKEVNVLTIARAGFAP
jgi:ComF family protein